MVRLHSGPPIPKKMEKPSSTVTNFEKRITSPVIQEEISQFEKEFDLTECVRGVQFSTFDRKKLKLVFSPSEDKFEKIVRKNKPNEIYYNEINMDDVGNWGSLCIKQSKDIEIYSSLYIWGYLGIWNLLEKLGYKDEATTTGFKNHSGKFVLKI